MPSAFIQRQLDALGIRDVSECYDRSKKSGGNSSGAAIKRKLMNQLRALDIPDPVREHRFHPTRLWRFDWAWPDRKVALEYEGGIHHDGRHTRGKGFEADIDKYNAAQLLGWKVYRCSYDQVKDGRAAKVIERALRSGGNRHGEV